MAMIHFVKNGRKESSGADTELRLEGLYIAKKELFVEDCTLENFSHKVS